MSTTLDGQSLFDEQQLTVELESQRREAIEKSVAGLDGLVSIDLGGRGRVIKQQGVLRAASRTQMEQKISAISDCLDGDTHTLITHRGEEFKNLRMDVFEFMNERAVGNGLCCDYKIVYMQLAV